VNDEIHSLIGAYAVDALTEQERRTFEEHLDACAHCRAELIGLRETAAHLGGSVQDQPPADLRATVLGQIGAVRPLPPILPEDSAQATSEASTTTPEHPPATRLSSRRQRHYRLRRRWLTSVAAAAAILVGAVAWHPWTGSTPAQVSASQQVLHASDAQRLVKHLDGTTATLVYSHRLAKAVLITSDMAPAPQGHTYQVWYMTASGAATGAGFVHPSGGGKHSSVLLKGNADEAAVVGVTIEPAGGSPQPTTKPIMTMDLPA